MSTYIKICEHSIFSIVEQTYVYSVLNMFLKQHVLKTYALKIWCYIDFNWR